ncbi:MAG: tetratricopeptide repeat protein [Terriglobia bacterium]
MILAMRALPFALACVFAAAVPGLCPAEQKGFDQIARDADAARTNDRMQEAIHLYRQGVGLRPTWQDGWWWLGSLYYEQDRFSEAQAALERFVAIAPKPGPAHAFLGLSEYETRDYARSLEQFRKWAVAGSPGTNELIDVASFHWALLLTREGRFVQALYLFAAKAVRRGGGPALTEAMGLASLRMAYLPEDYPPQSREMVWLAGKAAFYATLVPHQFDRAQDYEDKLLLHYDQAPNVHYFRGTLFGFQKKQAAAKEEYRQELRVSPQHAPAMMELARLDLDDGQLDEALSLARHAAELDPKNPAAHHVLGQTLFAKGQMQESTRELEIARQMAPDSAAIRLHLMTVYRKVGRTKDAEREFAMFTTLKEKEEVLLPPEELQDLLHERQPTVQK